MINLRAKEVYDGIPTIVTTFVAIIPKISIFIFLLELVHYTSESMLEFNWTSLLLVSSLLSLIIGSVVGLIQHRIKRLLAYSAISTTGFLLLALSINSIESIQSFLFYLLQYSLSNLNVFFILILIGYYLLEIDRNSDRRLLDKNNSPALRYGKPLLLWDLLPNSGDSLKLLVPNYNRKIISGWSNYSCKVTSHKMIEKEMGYRGSKSESFSVKEQRVDGNRCIKFMHLRYTLMGFERNYQIKILSNQQNKSIRKYTSIANQTHNLGNEINPVFLTGFSDASLIQKSIRQFSTKSSNTNNTNLSLVIWGTNLTSTVGTGRFSKQVSNMIILAPYQYSVIIGLLLSDGWITFDHKNARLGFKQSLDHSQYVLFVFNILSHYCSSSPRLTTGIRAGNRFYGLQFFTRLMPCLTELHSLFYPNGIKIIPQNIYELLTPVA